MCFFGSCCFILESEDLLGILIFILFAEDWHDCEYEPFCILEKEECSNDMSQSFRKSRESCRIIVLFQKDR